MKTFPKTRIGTNWLPAGVIAVLTVLIALFCLFQNSLGGLEFYVGKDMAKASEVEQGRFIEGLRALTGDKHEANDWNSLRPWWVSRFDGPGASWLVLEAYPGYNIPDMSHVRLHVFDATWKRTSKSRFLTGYRMFLSEASVEKQPSIQQDLFVAKMTSAGSFVAVSDEKLRPAFDLLQYYGLLGTNIVMVRLEDGAGRMVRNHYRWSNPTLGPPVPIQSKETWIAALGSTNLIEQLSALVWVTGSHLLSDEERKSNHEQESVVEAKLFESVRDDIRTEAYLTMLKNHSHPWVREYAEMGVLDGK